MTRIPIAFFLTISAALALLAGWPAALGGPLAAPDPPDQAELFTDQATASGIDFVHFNGMSGEFYLPEITGAGAALFDYDGDGDLDAYMVQGAMLGGKELADATFPLRHPAPPSDRLYRNDTTLGPDGRPVIRFVDVTDDAGLEGVASGYGMAAAAGDYDGDGWVDLYLANTGPNQLLHNQGDGTFTDVTTTAGVDDPRWSVSSSFVDFDRDGHLDLYVTAYVDFSMAVHIICKSPTGAPDYCGPLVYEPIPDRLFRNLGDGTFQDVSSKSGIGNVRGSGLGVVAADFDGDGWTDVYVANDGMENHLWKNLGDGTFLDDATLAGCAVNFEGKAEASMGLLAEDVDGDGDEDLFMTHLDDQTNTLYVNDGDGLFQDRTVQSGLGPPSMGATTFGAGFLDFDNDGELDLLLGNGAVVLIEDLVKEGDPYPLDQPNQLLRNQGSLRFEDMTGQAGSSFQVAEVTRGIAFGDVDHDGDTDALLNNNAGPARLLINAVGQDNRWIGVRALRNGRDAFGTRVRVETPGQPARWRRVHTDGSYASASDPRVLVGLGREGRQEEIAIHWPDGAVRRLLGLPADTYLTIYRDESR